MLCDGAVAVEAEEASLRRTAGKEAFMCFRASDRRASAKLTELEDID